MGWVLQDSVFLQHAQSVLIPAGPGCDSVDMMSSAALGQD